MPPSLLHYVVSLLVFCLFLADTPLALAGLMHQVNYAPSKKGSGPVVPIQEPEIEYDTVPPMVTCPRNYILSGNGRNCVRQMSVSADSSCAVGYTMQNGQCYRPIFTQPDQICPRDYTRDRNGQCVQIDETEVETFCPPSYTLNRARGTCDRTTLADAAPVCSSGFKLSRDGECKRQEQPFLPDMPPQCEPGAVLSGSGKCIFKRTDEEEPRRVCPGGYTLQKGYCVKWEEPDLVCPRAFVLNPNNNLCQRDYEEPATDVAPDAIPTCTPPSVMDSRTGLCTESAEPDYNCPPGTTAVGGGRGGCRMTDSTDADTECPLGYELVNNGRQCQRVQQTQPDAICAPPGQLIDGQCVSYDTGASVPVCPSGGYSLDTATNQCVRTETINPVLDCPAGYQMFNNECMRPIKRKPAPPPPSPKKYSHPLFYH
eukprot:Filipodium_phascolosomae@DN2420_c0_g1_i1.p1